MLDAAWRNWRTMESEKIINLMVFMTIFGMGKEWEYECYSLDVVENIDDVIPIEFYNGRTDRARGTAPFGERASVIDSYFGGVEWGVGGAHYVMYAGEMKLLGIVRGGVGLETVVFVDWDFLNYLTAQ